MACCDTFCDWQVTVAQLEEKAWEFRACVRSGESMFRSGRLLHAYEQTLSAAVAVGRIPPPLPGGWIRPHLRICGTVPDLHAERRLLHGLLLPALRGTLLSRHMILSWDDPGYCGAQQAPSAESELPLHLRLSALDTDSAATSAHTPLAAGDSILFFIAILGGRAGKPQVPRLLVLSGTGSKLLRARVWAGDVAEASGHPRIAGREQLGAVAEVELQSGGYEPQELARAFQHALNSAEWGGVFSKCTEEYAAFRWEWVVDQGHLHIRLWGRSFYAFELHFYQPRLLHLMGFSFNQQVAGVAVRSGSPERIGAVAAAAKGHPMGWAWMTEAAAEFPITVTEERQVLGAHHKVLSNPAWKRVVDGGGSSAVEILRACILRPRGAECVILRRNQAFFGEGRFAAARLSGTIPRSVSAVFEPPFGSAESIAVAAMSDLILQAGLAENVYNVQFETFRYNSEAAIEKVQNLYPNAVAAAVAASSNEPRIEMNELIEAEMSDAATRLRDECLGWWRLVAEEWEVRRAGCPHGVNGEVCHHPSCLKIRNVACAPALRGWAATDAATIKTSSGVDENEKGSHEAARAAGLDLGLEGLGSTAFARLYDSVEAYAPCHLRSDCPEINRVPMLSETGTSSFAAANFDSGPEGVVFHSHVLERARQANIVTTLAAEFRRPHGQSRDRALVELDRLTSGPPAARPPFVFLAGPPHSGRSAALAAFSKYAMLQAASGIGHQRRPSAALPTLRGVGKSGATDLVVVYLAPAAFTSEELRDQKEYGILRTALEYLEMEIKLQLNGGTVMSEGGGDASAARMLLSSSAREQLEDAEVRLTDACRAAISAGARLLLLVDGLPFSSIIRFGRISLTLHNDAVRARCLTRRDCTDDFLNGGYAHGSGGIQVVLTGEAVPAELRSETRVVPLEPLTLQEREIICLHWLRRYGLKIQGMSVTGSSGSSSHKPDTEDAQVFVAAAEAATATAARIRGVLPPFIPIHSNQSHRFPATDAAEQMDTDVAALNEGVQIIIRKRDAYLPLFLSACAHLVARWILCDPDARHRPSAAGTGRLSAVLAHLPQRLAAAPGTILGFWQKAVFEAAEQRWGRETVRWVLLHLANHPEGVPAHDLKTFARASMETLLRLYDCVGHKSPTEGVNEAPATHAPNRDLSSPGIDLTSTSQMSPGPPGRLVILASKAAIGGRNVLLDPDTLCPLQQSWSTAGAQSQEKVLEQRRRVGIKGALRGLPGFEVSGTGVDTSAGSSVRPVPGVVWCSDAELAGLLHILLPFIQPTVSAFAADSGDDCCGQRVSLAHCALVDAVLVRYDSGNQRIQTVTTTTLQENEVTTPYARWLRTARIA